MGCGLMASWFYLYLCTDRTQRMTTYIDAIVRKETKIMSNRAIHQQNIEIDEATTHWIEATVNDAYGTAMDLTGCKAIFTAGTIEKECDIEGNVVSVKLEPEETTGYLSSGYQIRVFDSNNDVLQIIQGIIYIRKAHKPYTINPLSGGE